MSLSAGTKRILPEIGPCKLRNLLPFVKGESLNFQVCFPSIEHSARIKFSGESTDGRVVSGICWRWDAQ